jgi:deoxyribonuclease V
VLAAFRKLPLRPDVVLCDGQGYAHPRRFGLACHLGLWLDAPTIGCAKSRLIGTFVEPGRRRGSTAPLLDADEEIGRVVRTRDGVAPLYVSSGHKCDLASAAAVVLACASRYRQPEVSRRAHDLVNTLRRADADRSP